MIIVMQAGATRADLDHVVRRVESLGLRPHVIVGTERTVVAVVGDERGAASSGLETLPGVASVMPILAPYQVASREVQSEPTVVRAGPLVVGGGTVGVIAGPCSDSFVSTWTSKPASRAARAIGKR
jgi:3-deoxy-7-phosphoheptulonate synthase